MRRALLPIALIAVFASLTFAPAQAAVNATLSASPAAYSGSCPTDITFTGSISSGTGVTVLYRFVRSDGSTNPASDKISHTFSTAGTANVADAWYQVKGGGSDSLEVYNASGALLKKATASFTVTCASAGGAASTGRFSVTRTRTTEAFKAAPLSIGLVPPTNLGLTNDPAVCAQHLPIPLFAGAVCAGAIQAGKLVLVWDWTSICPGDPKCPPAEGYRVYPSRTNATPVAITTTNGTASTMTAIDAHASPTGCYAVAAFKGNIESDTSVDFCVVGFTPGLPNLVLTPSSMRTVEHEYSWSGLPPSGHLTASLEGRASVPYVTVGFDHYYKPSHRVDNTAIQGAVLFDLSGLAGKGIISASLNFENITPVPANSTSPDRTSCLAAISLSKIDWSNYSDWIPRDNYITGIPWGYKNKNINTDQVHATYSRAFVVDVTSAVRDWVAGYRPNFGFVFVSGDEDTGANDNVACYNDLASFKLMVKYSGG